MLVHFVQELVLFAQELHQYAVVLQFHFLVV